MKIESAVTAISWIPSEAIEGMPKLPFEFGATHYDDPPPDRIKDVAAMAERDEFREANELCAWIEVEDGRIVGHGYSGKGHLGVTRIKVGPKTVAVPAVAMPTLQAEPEVGPDWVKFRQTAGGRTGMPAPRHVHGKPYFQISSALAWTTLELTIHADGTSHGELAGASTFPRHWVYDAEGSLVAKSGLTDFKDWYRKAFGNDTPWGGEDMPAFVTEVESALERQLSLSIMRGSEKPPKPKQVAAGEALVEQGEAGDDLFLLLDGVVSAEVDGEPVAEIGPGAILGEHAVLEGGVRTATLRALTPLKVVVVPGDRVDPGDLSELAADRRREKG
jgi:hypothetical protein